MPQQVGDFKLKGEVKPVDIVPPNQYRGGAGRPIEGAVAQYEASNGTKLKLQVVKYSSASDADESLEQMVENVRNLAREAKVTEGTMTGRKQKSNSRKVVIEHIGPGFHAVMWVDTSLFYQVAGDNLEAALAFEQKLP